MAILECSKRTAHDYLSVLKDFVGLRKIRKRYVGNIYI